MMKSIDIHEAIALAKAKKSLDGIVIKDLTSVQIRSVDAIALAEAGILIPEQNIIYRDEDVAHDPEFDNYKWTKLPPNTNIEDLSKIASEKEI